MKGTASELMPIGRFAERSRLSLKALRLYDAMGLLPPAHIDPESGYRYYRDEQLAQAKLIGFLRQLEMPLGRIAKVIEYPGAEATREIVTYWQEVEADVRAKRRLVGYLTEFLNGKGEIMHQVATRELPEQKVLTFERRVYAKELPRFIEHSFNALHVHLAQSGLTTDGAPFVVYHGEVNEDSDGPVEVCVPFEGSVEPAGEMRVRLEPAHQEAYTRITKTEVEFPGILRAFESVHRWLQKHDKTPSAAPREVYFAPWDEVGVNDPACDIAWPFRD
jgi:DNA-binding transcriptional MerR regulator